MKKLSGLGGIFSLLLFCQCSEEYESVSQKVAIEFTAETAGNDFLKELPPDSRLFLSLKTLSGAPVFDYEETAFEFKESRFVSESLELPYGSYVITDFVLVNGEDEVIYIAPKVSGELSGRVEKALDLQLTLTAGKSAPEINLQLLEVGKRTASDFGYSSFRKPNQTMKIMVMLEGTSKPTSANAFVLQDRDTLYRYKLLARMNQLMIPGSTPSTAQLVIARDGYAPIAFSLKDVRLYKNKPLKVYLSPAFAFMAHLTELYYNPFEFALSGVDGSSITIHWGDGTTGTYALNSEAQPLTHEYASTGNHPITITGDIEKITYFKCFYDNLINQIDFQHLTGLREIHFGLTGSPEVVDLSHNAQLEVAILPALGSMRVLSLAKTHRIRTLSVEGNGLSTAVIDEVIHSVYKNAVTQNISNGYFGLGAVLYQPPWDDALVGPPSLDALDKLKDLKEKYGWEISPDPFD